MTAYNNLDYCALDGSHGIWVGRLPAALIAEPELFEALWDLHPAEFHDVRTPAGKWVKTPRWQQAYGRDYKYTGSKNNALETPSLLEPFENWAREHIDPRLDGLLLNWYDADRGHYIGRHRDNEKDLLKGAPIVTISFGASRVFRLRPWKGNEKGFRDLPAENGTVFVLPWDTNMAWTHEVPRGKRFPGRRVSITLRAFVP